MVKYANTAVSGILGLIIAASPVKYDGIAQKAVDSFSPKAGIEQIIEVPTNSFMNSANAQDVAKVNLNQIDQLIQTYRNEIDGKINPNIDYETALRKLNEINTLLESDLNSLDAKRKKDLAEVFNDYGVALKKQISKEGKAEYGRVAELYKKAIDLNPMTVKAKVNFGFLVYQHKLGDYETALRLVDEVLEDNPDNSMAKFVKEKLETLI